MTFTKDQIHDAIISRHKEVFGYIGKDDEGGEVHRDGYFIAGFVKDALDNFEQSSEPVSLKRIVMLRYDDAINIAKGCLDYCGGHGGKELEIYHHGIQTVINALKGAEKSGLSDLQSKVLHRKGKAT